MEGGHNNARTGWCQLMHDIADAIGDDVLALELQTAYAGRRLYVPAQRIQSSKLARLIGAQAARRLAEAGFGGDYILMPTLRNARIGVRHEIEIAQGAAAEVAKRYDVSERWVRQVRMEKRLRERKAR